MIEDVISIAKNRIAKEVRDEIDQKKEIIVRNAVETLKQIERCEGYIAKRQEEIVILKEKLDAMNADPVAYYDKNYPTSNKSKPWKSSRSYDKDEDDDI